MCGSEYPGRQRTNQAAGSRMHRRAGQLAGGKAAVRTTLPPHPPANMFTSGEVPLSAVMSCVARLVTAAVRLGRLPGPSPSAHGHMGQARRLSAGAHAMDGPSARGPMPPGGRCAGRGRGREGQRQWTSQCRLTERDGDGRTIVDGIRAAGLHEVCTGQVRAGQGKRWSRNVSTSSRRPGTNQPCLRQGLSAVRQGAYQRPSGLQLPGGWGKAGCP